MEQFGRAKVDIADKVRKLLAKAEDPAASAMEAEALVAKAQELISRYFHLRSDAGRYGGERSWSSGRSWSTAPMPGAGWVWSSKWLRPISAAACGWPPPPGYLVAVVGQASDVEWTSLLHNSLEFQLASALTRTAGTAPRPSMAAPGW